MKAIFALALLGAIAYAQDSDDETLEFIAEDERLLNEWDLDM